jgi:Sulfotransferase family
MKPRVLYVLGYGRSGSTVLGMALGQHPGLVNLGEISTLPTFIPGPTYIAPRACGCLRPLDQCPYWQGVARRVGSMAALAQDGTTLSPTMGWRRYAPWLPAPSDELPRWASAAASMYGAAIAEAGATVAVDTSKGAQRAWWLWHSGEVELSFVWLTRHLEGVIRSQVRHGNSALKTAVSWRLAQFQAAQVARAAEHSGLRVPRISYERLVQEPREVLGEVLAHVGLPWDDAVLTPRPAHTIGGEHEGKHGGRLSIEPSTRARSPLPLASRLAVRVFDGSSAAPRA